MKSAHQVEKDLWLAKEKEMNQSIDRKNEELVKANELSASSRCDIDSLNKRISDLTSGNNALLKKITKAQHEYELKIKELEISAQKDMTKVIEEKIAEATKLIDLERKKFDKMRSDTHKETEKHLKGDS